MKTLSAILKFVVVFAALATIAMGIVNPLIWQACDNCDLGIIGIAYGYYGIGLIVTLPLSIVITKIILHGAGQYTQLLNLDQEFNAVSFIFPVLPLGILLYLLILRSFGWLIASTTSTDVLLIVFGTVGLLFIISLNRSPLQLPLGAQKPILKLAYHHVLILLLGVVAGITGLFQASVSRPVTLPTFVPSTFPLAQGTTTSEPPRDNTVEMNVPLSYEKTVEYFKSASPNAGWPIIASWDYSGNSSSTVGPSGWPTKIIASDKKQTVRLTIYPGDRNETSRVTIDVENHPCYRVVENEECRTSEQPELITDEQHPDIHTTTYSNPVYHYQITTPSTWEKGYTVYAAEQARSIDWRDKSTPYSDSVGVEYSDSFAEFLRLGLNGSQNEQIGAETFEDFIVHDPDLKDVRKMTVHGYLAYAAINTYGEPQYNHLEIYIQPEGHIYTISVSGSAPFTDTVTGKPVSYLGLFTSSDITKLPEPYRKIVDSFTILE